MRRKVTPAKLDQFMRELAAAARGPGKVYLTDGATALLLGFREQTIDIDLKLDPEPKGAFEAIASLKNRLELNIELASPADFIPAPPDWRERSRPIAAFGKVEFFHFDFAMQALAKLERGHAQDLDDVKQFLSRGIVTPVDLRETFARIRPALIRYPAIDEEQFRGKIEGFLNGYEYAPQPDGTLPGEELVKEGLADLAAGCESDSSLLLQIAAPRLRRLGILVRDSPSRQPHEHALYHRLELRMGAAAHSYYNSLIRRIVSYAHALEQEQRAR